MATTSSGFLFSGIAEVAMQHVVVCLKLVRPQGKPLPPPETEGPDGQVEYRKAECGETRPLRVRREARYDIPAASRGNWGKVLGLLAYLAAKAKGDQACQASDACPKAL